MRCFRIALVVLCGCHLADPAEPAPCPAGQKRENAICVLDEAAVTTIRIASCLVTPNKVNVKVNADLEFRNDDAVAHVVFGQADGVAWATIPAGGRSDLIAFQRAATFDYRVSSCGGTGTIVVDP